MHKVLSVLSKNKRIVENFFSLGIINILNSCFHIIIYPLLIKRLGSEMYGEYVYSLSIVLYFLTFITYGLDMIGTRRIAIFNSQANNNGKSEITSSIISLKFYLFLVCTVVLCLLLLYIPNLRERCALIISIYAGSIGYIFIPNWYFVGIQRTKMYLVFQVGSKIVLFFLVLHFVHTPSDNIIYALSVSFVTIMLALLALIYLIRQENLRLTLHHPKNCITLFKEGGPLYLANLMVNFKTSGINILIAQLFGMTTLTGYDFSMKIINIVTIGSKSLNTAIFPSFSAKYDVKPVKLLMFGEIVIGIFIMAFLYLLREPTIYLMGNENIASTILPIYTVALPLIPIWLMNSFFIDLVLTANGQNNAVFINQLISLLLTTIGCIIAYISELPPMGFIITLVVSGIIEVIFLIFLSKRYSLISL